jgi:hypothetical protein
VIVIRPQEVSPMNPIHVGAPMQSTITRLR